MISVFKKYLALLSPKQRRWVWLATLTVVVVAINRIALHTSWLTIFIVLALFASKELFEYSRRRANAKADWK